MGRYMKFTEKFEPYNELNLNGVRLPSFKIEKKYYDRLGLDPKTSNNEFLRKLCREGSKTRGVDGKKEYEERTEKELSLFEELGYVDYILLIWDIINYANEKGIAVGLGRGSSAGSNVLYLIGVTGVDPIKYDLLFERFVSRARSKSMKIKGITYYDGSLLPDVDVDFEYTRRHEIIEYIQKKYKGKTCKVLTVTNLKGKLCIKECCKIVGGYDDNIATEISAKIDKAFGNIQGLSEAINEGLKDWIKKPREKYQFTNNLHLTQIAQKIEGLPKNFGIHASAMGVSYQPLKKCCPVQLTKDGEIISSYTKNDIEQIMVKVDALGLKTLTVVDSMSKITGDDFRKIDFEDPEILENLNGWQENLYGIFQFEGHTALKATLKVKPESLFDMSAINSLARPGSIMFIDKYAARKNDGEEIPEIHPKLDAITKETYGFLIYQEQIMRAFHEVFGFTLEEAEILRRIIGRKKIKEIDEWKPKIYEAGKNKGINIEIVDAFWDNVQTASNYSFNKCLMPDTVVETKTGPKCMFEVEAGEEVLSYNVKNDKDHYVEVLNKYENKIEVFEVKFDDGKKIKCSMDHKFLCEDKKMHTLRDILGNNLGILCKD